jgi:hypothetical protein
VNSNVHRWVNLLEVASGLAAPRTATTASLGKNTSAMIVWLGQGDETTSSCQLDPQYAPVGKVDYPAAATLAHLDDGNDRVILVQGHEGPAQIVRLGHRGTPSIDVSDEIAILAARPIASLRWREMDSNFQYAGAVNLFVALF